MVETPVRFVDGGGKVTPPVYTLVVTRKFGRIWTLKREVQPDVLLTVLRGEQHGRDLSGGPMVRPHFTAVAFNVKAETLAATDDRGNVFLFHVTK